MFDSDYDPLARLDNLEAHINGLRSDIIQLARATQDCLNAIAKLQKIQDNLITQMNIHNNDLQLLEVRLNLQRTI